MRNENAILIQLTATYVYINFVYVKNSLVKISLPYLVMLVDIASSHLLPPSYCTCSWLWQILQCLFYIFLSFCRSLNLFFVCISHNWNQNKANVLFKNLFLLIFRYNFLIVCLFFAFSHPSWQPLLIKNLKNRNQGATQHVKLLESCQLCFFSHIFSSHARFRKKCLPRSFLPVNLDN